MEEIGIRQTMDDLAKIQPHSNIIIMEKTELDVVNKLGIATSDEVAKEMNKMLKSTINQLESWEKLEMLKIETCNTKHGCKRRLYISNEVYQDLFGDERQKNRKS